MENFLLLKILIPVAIIALVAQGINGLPTKEKEKDEPDLIQLDDLDDDILRQEDEEGLSLAERLAAVIKIDIDNKEKQKRVKKKNKDESAEEVILHQHLNDKDGEPKDFRRRRKRSTMSVNADLWEKGIVPYTFDETEPETPEAREKIKVSLDYLESISCIRFVEYTPTTHAEYGLNHTSYLNYGYFIGGVSKCFSSVGRSKTTAQNVATCQGGAATHETIHALGAVHENQRSDGYKWRQVFLHNIAADEHWIFKDKNTVNIKPYDLSSVMHSSLTRKGQTSMGLYDPDMEFLVGRRDARISFNDVLGLNLAYKCKENHCPDFPLQCENNGFVGYIEGECKCVCPDHMMGETCEQIYTPASSPTQWPTGSYTLPQSVDGCPTGFLSGTRVQSSISTNYVRMTNGQYMPVDWKVDKNDYAHKFCSADNMQGGYEWPAGTYCILRRGGSCPTGFIGGSRQFDDRDDDNINSVSGELPDGVFNEDTLFYYCCREDASITKHIKLPVAKPFMLHYGYPDEECQQVAGTAVVVSRYGLSPETAQNNTLYFVEPYPDFSSTQHSKYNMLYLHYCYYVPLSYDCGGIIDLTGNTTTAVVTSPNYPANYNLLSHCTWFIKAPEGKTLKLTFDHFDVVASSDPDCLFNYLEIRHHTVDIPGARYCGVRFNRTLISGEEYMMLVLRSFEESSTGFSATFTVVDNTEYYYDTAVYGLTYNGTVNYTQRYKPCVSWTQTTNCPVNLYDSAGILGLNNFCRNPSGALGPWCYSDTNCTIDYCDVSGIVDCYDNLHNCTDVVAANSSYCATFSGFEQCHKTCSYCGQGVPQTRGSGVCPDPELSASIFGAIDPADVKTTYKEGDQVTFSCHPEYGYGSQTRLCMSDGTWQSLGELCSSCPEGFVQLLPDRCFSWSSEELLQADAKMYCDDQFAGAYLARPKTYIIQDAIETVLSDGNKYWIGLEKNDDNSYSWEDGEQLLGFLNWMVNYTIVSSCVRMIPSTTDPTAYVWQPRDCSKDYYALCEIPSKAVKSNAGCEDGWAFCSDLLQLEPQFCQNQSTLAEDKCRKTCGYCIDPSCGGSVTLDLISSTAVVIQSPGYPYVTYPNNYYCQWLIQAPVGAGLKLEYESFDVGAPSVHDPACEVDYVEMRMGDVTKDGMRYCNNNWLNKTLLSSSNVIMLLLRTLDGEPAQGFSASVSIISGDEFHFDPAFSGLTYRGSVSYTADYKICLSWDQVMHCPVNFMSGFPNLGVDNYCRNPNGDFSPWCYLDTDCNVGYCDVSGIGMCYDHLQNCQSLIDNDSSYCTTGTGFELCHNTCSFCGQDIPAQPPIGVCLDPEPTMFGVIDPADVRASYVEGDEVTFNCHAEYGYGSQTRMCMSDGTWLSIGELCAACPDGEYDIVAGRCFNISEDKMSFEAAEAYCHEVTGRVMAMPKTQHLQNALEYIVNPSQRHWIGLKDVDDEMYMWNDGTHLGLWDNIQEPSSYNCGSLLEGSDNFGWKITYCKWNFWAICQEKSSLSPDSCNDGWDFCEDLPQTFCQDHIDWARKNCRKTCGHCPATCAPPPISPYRTILPSDVKETYVVDDEVTFTCDPAHGFGSHVQVCMSDGTWQSQSEMCSPCPNGGIDILPDLCVFVGDTTMNFEDGRSSCELEAGRSLVMPKTAEIQSALELTLNSDNGHWIGLKEEDDEFIWVDGTVLGDYTNWEKITTNSCTRLLKSTFGWKAVGCNNEFYPICQQQPAMAAAACADGIDGCATELSENPTFCEDDWYWARKGCRQTCGMCPGV